MTTRRMRTGEVAQLLGISSRRVRRLTEHARPRPLPCRYEGDEQWRTYDQVAVVEWDDERIAYWRAISRDLARRRLLGATERRERAQRRAVERREQRVRAAEEALVRCGVSRDLVGRWRARGWLDRRLRT